MQGSAVSARGLVVAGVACAAVLALLALAKLERGTAREPVAPVTTPAGAPAGAELAPAPPLATLVPERSAGTDAPAADAAGRFALVAVPPPEWPFTGSVRVTVRRATGELVRELVLPPDAPEEELTCADGEYVVEARHAGPPELASLPLALVVDGDTAEPVRLALVPARALAGTVADVNGRAVVDVPLALALGERPVAETRTGPDGGFLFPPLAEGEYQLVVGDPLGPLVPRRALSLDGALGLVEIVVPPLLDVVVRVVDDQGLALPDVEVEGTGESGGRIAGVTDARGELHVRALPPGNWRLFARDPVLGRGTRAVSLSTAVASAPVEIQLVRRR